MNLCCTDLTVTTLRHFCFSDVFKYLEKTAFFCDLLVFFPGITLKLLDVHILWRVTLIDSIQDVMSLNLNFIDENTLKQFDKVSLFTSYLYKFLYLLILPRLLQFDLSAGISNFK